MNELVLVNGLILADPDKGDVLPHGVTVISRGELAQVNSPADGKLFATPVIDCSGCLIMPGLINLHNHAAMSLLRGLADDLPLDAWLNDYVFPSERRHVNPQSVYLGTALSAMEMALNGISTCADGYFFMEHAAQAFIDVGIRAVVAQGILDVPVPDAPEAGAWRERIDEFLFSCPRDPLITPALFCHSPYLCSPDTLKHSAKIAQEHKSLLFCHVAETALEVEQVIGRYGRRPVQHLASLELLGRGLVAVHCVHLSDGEKDLLAKSGTGIVHCPESNMKLASGASPVWELLSRGITIGLGTDGPASNNNLDLFEEMRTASFAAKLLTRDPQALTARQVLKMATTDAARILGMADKIGSLESGKQADIAIVDLDRPHLTPLYDPISHLVYAARGSDVRDVIVHGRIVVRNGRLTRADEAIIKEQAFALAEQIRGDVSIQGYCAASCGSMTA